MIERKVVVSWWHTVQQRPNHSRNQADHLLKNAPLSARLLLEVTEGGTQHDEEKSLFLVYMRGRADYIHKYAKDLGINDDEAVYLLFYLRHLPKLPTSRIYHK